MIPAALLDALARVIAAILSAPDQSLAARRAYEAARRDAIIATARKAKKGTK